MRNAALLLLFVAGTANAARCIDVCTYDEAIQNYACTCVRNGRGGLLVSESGAYEGTYREPIRALPDTAQNVLLSIDRELGGSNLPTMSEMEGTQ